jgi:hypothetical protein
MLRRWSGAKKCCELGDLDRLRVGSKYNVLVVHLHCGSEEIARRAYFTRSKTYLVRVIRDIGRRIADDDALEELFTRELSLACCVPAQDR